MNARADRFPLMDSMRAIAALSVLTVHIALPSGLFDPRYAGVRFFGHLDVGVAVFFCISGFLLYRPFVVARVTGNAPSAGAYAWRRALRIIPAYWLALTVTALVLHDHSVFTGRGLWTYYGFAQIYSNTTAVGGVSQAWTLCIEVTFYVFLPLWAWLMRRTNANELLGVGLLFVVGVAWKIAFLAGHDPVPAQAALRALPAYLDHFAVGMLLAVLSVRWHGSPLPRGIRVLDRFPALAWVGAGAAYVLLCVGIGLSGALFEPVTPRQYLLRHELFALVGAFVILPAVFGDPERGFLRRRVLANRVLLWLGLVSYGIYLWHQTIITRLDQAGFRPPAAPLTWAVVALAASAAVAGASYYAMERPLLSLKRLVGGRDRPLREALVEPAPAAPATVGKVGGEP